MKKILLLNGSMRGEASSSLKVAKTFIAGIQDCLDIQVTQINLREKKINPCMGCFYCWKKGKGNCILQDDMQQLRELVMENDIIIESFPLYFFGMPSQMKAFTDRMISYISEYRASNGDQESGRFLHEVRYPELMQKKFVMVSTCGYEKTEDCYDAIRVQFDRICGSKYTLITAPQGGMLAEKTFEAKTARYLTKFREAGKEYALQGQLSPETLCKLEIPMLGHNVFSMAINKNWDDEEVGPYGKPV